MPEAADISLRGVRVGLLVVAAGIAVSLVLAGLLVLVTDTSAAGTNGYAPAPIQGTTLQVVPGQDRAAYEREKRAQLERNDPVRDAPGRRYIPIERAMQRIAQ